MHDALLPLNALGPIALGDKDYPAKLELLRTTAVSAIDNSLTYVDNQVATAQEWAVSMTVVSGGLYGAQYYAQQAATLVGNANTTLAACNAALTTMAGGPVISINGKTGVVTFGASDLADGALTVRARRRALLALISQ